MMEIYTLLNPKTPNYNGTGGIPSIVPEDVAACLGRIKTNGPALLVRTMAGDLSSRKPLAQIFRQNVALMASQKRWKTGPKFWDYFEGMVECVLHFYLKPRICYRCKGRLTVATRAGPVIDCPVCVRINEDGQKVVNREPMEKDKARAANIPMLIWQDVWADRYTMARDILTAWEGEADMATKRLWWRTFNG